MARSIRLFVSSSPDLAAEREALGQAVAELPISTGWELKHTPDVGEDGREALAFIGHCDLYSTVLGSDFAAPMGLEWEWARKAGKPVLAFLKRRRRSPSAQSHLRNSTVAWTEFESAIELKGRLTRALAQILLDRGEQFGLHLDDITGLLAETEQVQEGLTVEPDRLHGAGKGGVILSRDRKSLT